MEKQKRSLFQKIFKTNKSVVFGESMQMLNNYNAIFTSFGSSIYDSTTARSCIDAIARNGAKLHPKHIRQTGEKFEILNYRISRLIAEQPNQIMNAYDFYYKIISRLYLDNNIFVYIERDAEKLPVALYPIHANISTIIEYEENYYVRFNFGTGKTYTASYDDVIHLRRFFCENDVLGGNATPLRQTLELQHTTKEGIANSIKTTAGIKGIIKTTQAMLKDEDIKRQRDNFVRDFINSENSNGIAGLDAKTEFKEVNIDPKTATAEQMQDIKNDILEYFGVSAEILKSSYDENQWNAFYESVLEPLAIQMSLEFTNKMFTIGQKAFGNKIVFESQRIQYASNKTKIDIARYLNNYFTKNEIREIFNMAPDPDGDIYLQDLNHISSEIADEYQGGGTKNE